MSSYPPTMPTFTPGITPYTSFQTISDGINWLNGTPRLGQTRRPWFSLVQTAAQSLATGTDTRIFFDSEVADTDGGHSTTVNTSRYTCQTTGAYVLFGQTVFATNTTGGRYSYFLVNGSTRYWSDESSASNLNATVLPVTGPIPLNAGDYVELGAYQNSGGGLLTDVTSTFGGSRFAGFMLGS